MSVLPAAVTPFDERGRVDHAGVARLIAYFESTGCAGAVLAGTNGEGPSLSAAEKRDLIKTACSLPRRTGFELILGIATSSLDEARWMTRQAGEAGADGVLLMAPGYFREAAEDAILAWFEAVMEPSPVPVIVYNFPQRTGFTLTAAGLDRLSRQSTFAGVKDSSGEEANIEAYASVLQGRPGYMGNELLLMKALQAGWTGTISGAANVVSEWLVPIVGDRDEVKFELLRPTLEVLRTSPQPAMNKAILHQRGIMDRPDVRLPLISLSPIRLPIEA